MKNIYLFVAFTLITVSAMAQCFIDSAAQSTPGIYPAPDSIPCIVSAVPYDQTIQVQCPSSFDSSISIIVFNYTVTVAVDSMELDSVIGLPYGIDWAKNPNTLQGGQNGCLTFTGTTTDATGQYNLQWYGTVWGTLPSPVPAPYNAVSYTGVLNRLPGFDYYVSVINQGDACPPSNIAAIPELNLDAAVSIYPNPTSGIFEFNLNTTNKITGDIIIEDITGRAIYTQKIDGQAIYHTSIDLNRYAKGIYTLELRTDNGFASKKLVIE